MPPAPMRRARVLLKSISQKREEARGDGDQILVMRNAAFRIYGLGYAHLSICAKYCFLIPPYLIEM
jgi:hypothetical protein